MDLDDAAAKRLARAIAARRRVPLAPTAQDLGLRSPLGTAQDAFSALPPAELLAGLWAPAGRAEWALRIALFTPVPPAKCGIADYASDLVEAWGRQQGLVVDVYSDCPALSAAPLRMEGKAVWPYGWFPHIHRERPYDCLLYQIGNSGHHLLMWPLLLTYPGVVELHDARLREYAGILHGSFGAQFLAAAWRAGGAPMLAAALSPDRESLPDAGLCVTLAGAKSVAVHNAKAQRFVSDVYDGPVHVVPLGVRTRRPGSRPALRKRLGIDGNGLVIVAGGHMGPSKMITELIASVELFLCRGGRGELHIVGECTDKAYERRARRAASRSRSIIWHGHVARPQLLSYLAACDCIVNLRSPAMAESSAMVSQALAFGARCITLDTSSHAELPDPPVSTVSAANVVEGLAARLAEVAEPKESRAWEPRAVARIRRMLDIRRTAAAISVAASSAPRHVCLIQPDSIGDVIIMDSVFRGLRLKFPQAAITFITRPVHADAVTDPDVQVIPWPQFLLHDGDDISDFSYVPGASAWGLESLALAQLGLKADAVYNFRSSPFGRMTEALGRDCLRTMFCRFVGVPDHFAPRIWLTSRERQAVLRHLPDVAFVVLHLRGGTHADTAKVWPERAAADLTCRLRDQGLRTVVVGGSTEEHDSVRGALDLRGQLSLRETMALVASATAVVAVDSCVMHMALAFRRPMVSLWPDAPPEHPQAIRYVLHPSERRRKGHRAMPQTSPAERVLESLLAACGRRALERSD